MISELHIAWAWHQAGQLLASGAWSDEEDIVARLGNRLARSSEIIQSWILAHEGHSIYNVCTQGAFRVPADRVHDLGRIIDQLRTYVESQCFFGVGVGIREAQEALRQAWHRQEPYAFYDEAAGPAHEESQDLDASLHDNPLQKGDVVDARLAFATRRQQGLDTKMASGSAPVKVITALPGGHSVYDYSHHLPPRLQGQEGVRLRVTHHIGGDNFMAASLMAGPQVLAHAWAYPSSAPSLSDLRAIEGGVVKNRYNEDEEQAVLAAIGQHAAAFRQGLLKHEDRLPGGIADKKKPEDFDAAALASGTAHEMEHTKDAALAQEIAMDHLAEDPKYYVKLKTLEKFQNDGNDHWMPAEKEVNDAQTEGGAQNPEGVAQPEPEEPTVNQGRSPAPADIEEPSSRSEGDDSEDGQQPESQDDYRKVVAEALLKIKQQAAVLQQLNGTAPQAFDAVKNLVQALVLLAHRVGEEEPPPAPDGEETQKAESLWKRLRLPEPKLSPKKVNMKYPDALASPASAAGTVKDGKIKVAPVEPQDGAPRPQGWNQARSGMIVGPHGSAVSSREPNTE